MKLKPLKLPSIKTAATKLSNVNFDGTRWNTTKKSSFRWLSGVFGHWQLIASALIAAAIIHILVTLSSAQFGSASSFRILSRNLPTNEAVFRELVTSKNQPLPFMNPDALYSYCKFDASSSRIRLSAKLPDAGWSLSLHTPKGQNFYFVSGSNKQLTDVELVLVPPGDVFAHGSIEVTEASQNVPQVKLPNVLGLAILRAPIKGFAYRRQIDELRASFACGSDNVAAQR